jgi:hypothetical protein
MFSKLWCLAMFYKTEETQYWVGQTQLGSF